MNSRSHEHDRQQLTTPTQMDPESPTVKEAMRRAAPRTAPRIDDREMADIGPEYLPSGGDSEPVGPHHIGNLPVIALLIVIAILLPVLAWLIVSS